MSQRQRTKRPPPGEVYARLAPPAADAADARRRVVSEFCRFLAGPGVRRIGADEKPGAGLSRRLGQTFERLLAGDSEKQVAASLGLSRHTVHVYVKALYKHFNVGTRAELLARHIRR